MNYLKCIDWEIKAPDEDGGDPEGTVFYITGKDPSNVSQTICVRNWKPYVYICLPKQTRLISNMKWTVDKCKTLFSYLKIKFKYSFHKMECVRCRKLYGNKLFLAMKVYFDIYEDSRNFSYSMMKSNLKLNVDGVGYFEGSDFRVDEGNVDPIIKFTGSKKLPLAGWIKYTYDSVYESIPEVDESNVFPASESETQDFEVFEKYMSFDIECASQNHNSKLPDPKNPYNKAFQIAIVIGEFGSKNPNKKILLSLFDPQDIPETEVLRFSTEAQILLEFSKIVSETNPDYFITYNGLKFDWYYLYKRAKILNILDEFLNIDRLKCLDVSAKKGKMKWRSDAYGIQEFKYVKCTGRLNIDVQVEVERNYKLPKYSLNTVAENFLKETKDDISPRQLFMLYQMNHEHLEATQKLLEVFDYQTELKRIQKSIQNIFPMRTVSGEVKTLRFQLLNAKTPQELLKYIRYGMFLTGKYCVQDTVLPVKLVQKLNLKETMESMANVMNVPMSYLHTRGQQIRVVAQMYPEILQESMTITYIPKNKFDKIAYLGAVVIEANPGDNDDVATLDFASLYPTVIQVYNICYTTDATNDETIPDEDCHILEWEEHRGCEHDHSGNKVDKKKILCGSHRYRFRKVKFEIQPDGTVIRKYEGLLPRLERTLLAERKRLKKQLAAAKAKLAMHLGNASETDLNAYRKIGYPILKKGSLSVSEEKALRVEIVVLDARQLAIKVSCNSMYGALGAQNGMIPLVHGAASVTAMGRKMIKDAIRYLLQIHSNAKLVYGDTDSCMIKWDHGELSNRIKFRKQKERLSVYEKCLALGISEKETFSNGDTVSTIKKSSLPLLKISERKKVQTLLNLRFSDLDSDLQTQFAKLDFLNKSFDLAEEASWKVTHYLKCQVIGISENFQIEDKYLYQWKSSDSKFRDLPENLKLKIIQYESLPIDLEFENMYGRYLLLTKKRYLAHVVNRKGELLKSIDKGVVTVRRDRSILLKKIYREMKEMILQRKSEREIMWYLYDSIQGIYTRQVSDPYYIIYMGITDVLSYVNKKEVNGQTVYLDSNNKPIPFESTPNPIDPRLVYKNYPQALLCLKMLRRGDSVPPNTRLEFLYLKTELSKVHQGHAAEDYTYYKENKKYEKLQIDPHFYLEKQIAKPVSELLRVKFPKRIIVYTDLDAKISSYIRNPRFGNLISSRIAKTRKYIKTIEDRQYVFTGQNAKIEFILESSKKSGPNEVDAKECADILETLRKYKAKKILEKLYSQFGLPKPKPVNKPTQTSKGLRTGAEIIFIRNFGEAKESDFGKIVDRIETNDSGTFRLSEAKPKKAREASRSFCFDIQLKNGGCVYNVPRNYVSTYTYADAKMFDNIVKYRKAYETLIEDLKYNVFCPVRIEE